jgi:hypothetical protein
VLPAPEHVDELEIDHLGLVLLGEFEEVIGLHTGSSLNSPVGGGAKA